jgi:hypothetical protein
MFFFFLRVFQLMIGYAQSELHQMSAPLPEKAFVFLELASVSQIEEKRSRG